jgi:hypothetical protein
MSVESNSQIIDETSRRDLLVEKHASPIAPVIVERLDRRERTGAFRDFVGRAELYVVELHIHEALRLRPVRGRPKAEADFEAAGGSVVQHRLLQIGLVRLYFRVADLGAVVAAAVFTIGKAGAVGMPVVESILKSARKKGQGDGQHVMPGPRPSECSLARSDAPAFIEFFLLDCFLAQCFPQLF